MADKSNIHLYSGPTPNGIKVSILLEELGLKYDVTAIEISKNTQKEPWFLEINPNGRFPALTDTFTDGTTIRLFESGSIMQYLVDRYDKDHKVSYPAGTKEYWEVNNWLMWQMAGLGPMQGQLNHFTRFAPEVIQYGIDRYRNETRRLYRTMETQLKRSASGYLVGDRVTVADIACWGWVACSRWSGVDRSEFPVLDAWMRRLLERPGFEKGRNVPSRHTHLDYEQSSDEELNKIAAGTRAWVQASMKEEAKKASA